MTEPLGEEKETLRFDEVVCRGAVLKDIDSLKVRWFLDEAEKQKRFTVPKKTTIKDALIRLNLLHGNKLTNTAILLFGKDPQKFFIQAKIRVARFKGVDTHDYIDMKEIPCNLTRVDQAGEERFICFAYESISGDAQTKALHKDMEDYMDNKYGKRGEKRDGIG